MEIIEDKKEDVILMKAVKKKKIGRRR